MDLEFEAFFKEKLNELRINLKKLSELTGIPLSHLENLSAGNFKELPPSPYIRGYLMKIGNVLNFDGEEWWKKLRMHGFIKNSGLHDQMPRNRFTQKMPMQYIWIGAGAALILIYFGFRFSAIFGRPELSVNYPSSTITTANVNQVILKGDVQNGNHLTINGEDIAVNSDGSWEKSVTLQNGMNTFEIDAKKLLGGETKTMRQIVYEAPAAASGTATSTPSQAK